MRAAAPYDVPVTMKTRKGIDDDHLTYLDAGRIAQEAGRAPRSRCTAARSARPTPAQADWDAIGELVAHVDIPVLGNGDIWEAADALRMVEQTGAAGVVVGRGCLGPARGCSATWPPRSRASRSRRCRRWARSPR